MRFLALCSVGLAGSLFLGYCVYFDRKRRSDPDYKKKVLASECVSTSVCATVLKTACPLLVGRRAAKKQGNTVDLRDPKVRQEFLTAELMKANQKISEGMELNVPGHNLRLPHARYHQPFHCHIHTQEN